MVAVAAAAKETAVAELATRVGAAASGGARRNVRWQRSVAAVGRRGSRVTVAVATVCLLGHRDGGWRRGGAVVTATQWQRWC